MKLSINWLRDLVAIDENYRPDELARRITNSIAEVEEFEVIGEDWDQALITVAEIAAIALPPRSQLSHEFAAANNALLRPILEANAPIKINRGTTDKS